MNNQEDKRLDKCDQVSRIILAIVTFIVFKIMFVNEDESWNVVAIVFAIIAYVISIPSIKMSKFFLKLVMDLIIYFKKYCIALPIISAFIVLGIYLVLVSISDFLPSSNDLSSALSQALSILFLIGVGSLCIIVPYIQTLIVLVIRNFIKK